MKINFKKILCGVFFVAAFLGLCGCSSINPYTGERGASDTAVGTGVGAVSGAVLGSILGGEKGALIGAFAGGATGAVIGNSMDRQNAELRERLVGTGVQVVRQGRNIQLSLASDVTFRFDSADINAAFYETLKSISIVLKKYKQTNIIIAGYTDSVGGDAYNQELSERRASSVGEFLMSQGVSRNRIFPQGFGKRNPVASNASEVGRAQNRRVEIVLQPR